MSRSSWKSVLLLPLLVGLAGCAKTEETPATPQVAEPPVTHRAADTRPATPALAIVAAARDQIGKTLSYDPAYTPPTSGL